MTIPFAIIAALTLASAIAAVSLRSLVHCALCLSVTFAGIALLYLQLNAQFVGFAQILVYIGAVAILIVFAILLTRNSENTEKNIFSVAWPCGVILALAVFGVLCRMILASRALRVGSETPPDANVAVIGRQLMTTYAVPLEVLGLLLTAALIGAVIVAMRDKETP